MQQFKIKANKEQLLGFGHKHDLTGLTGTLVEKHITGWYSLKVTHDVNGAAVTGVYDFPKTFLKEIKSKS
jgi:hypothetical protein